MKRLDHYISVGKKRLRCGYTTGTSAAAATVGAVTLLLQKTYLSGALIATPAGIDVYVEFEELYMSGNAAVCAVRKDAGDDPDVTDGVLVYARVERTDLGICIEGGKGVGRVTRKGLDQPPGAAAINHVPREMITTATQKVCEQAGYTHGLTIEISIPKGVELAAKTFNPRLGIEGGISVLGTSGIVRPMSEDALIASIELEMRVKYEAGARDLLVAPGNMGRDFAQEKLGLSPERCVQCANYLGATIDAANQIGYRSLLVVGALGKLVKVAAGVMNTHSRVADARRETMVAHAALQGITPELAQKLMDCVTTDAMLPLLAEAHILDETLASITAAIQAQLERRCGDTMVVGAVVFSQEYDVYKETPAAHELLARLLAKEA
ncbi:MAG: cobalt-precorrin-5B (C(1))-methyltransferase CbiD [Atopobiaceae bacterium]